MIFPNSGRVVSGCFVAAFVLLGTFTCLAAEGETANEGWINSVSKNTSVQFGAGTRLSARFNENEGSGNKWTNNFNLDNVRLYFGAQIFDFLGVTLNTDVNNAQGFEDPSTAYEDAGELRILDAIARFEFDDLFNIWAGRFLPPSDRSNLSGPYYMAPWDFPYVQFGYPNIFQGRDDGAAVWGQVGEGRKNGEGIGCHFKWQLGVFEGVDGSAGGINADDNLLYTGRAVVNLLDAEKGYYNSSTYFGAKDVLALGAAFMYQEDSTGIATAPSDRHDFSGLSLDFLFEKNLGEEVGTFTFEAAYYDFDDENVHQVAQTLTRQGESYFYLFGYLLPWEVGAGPVNGKVQLYFRYLDYRHSNETPGAPGYVEEGIDIGANYVLKGHDARIAVVYQRRDRGTGERHLDTMLIGTQLQF